MLFGKITLKNALLSKNDPSIIRAINHNYIAHPSGLLTINYKGKYYCTLSKMNINIHKLWISTSINVHILWIIHTLEIVCTNVVNWYYARITAIITFILHAWQETCSNKNLVLKNCSLKMSVFGDRFECLDNFSLKLLFLEQMTKKDLIILLKLSCYYFKCSQYFKVLW